jgi:cell division protein FtsN
MGGRQMTGITTVVVLLSVISVRVIIVYAGSQSRKRYKKENKELRDEIKNAAARPEHIWDYIKNQEDLDKGQQGQLNLDGPKIN